MLPFPVEARTGEPLHGPFTITIIVDGDRQKEEVCRPRARERGRWGRNVPRTGPVPLPRLSLWCSPSPPPPLPLLVIPQNAHRRPGSTGSTSVSRPALPPPPCITSFFCFCSFFFSFFFILLDQFLRRHPLPSLPSLPALNVLSSSVFRSLPLLFDDHLVHDFAVGSRPTGRVCILKAKDTAVF